MQTYGNLLQNDNPGPVTYDIDSAPEKCCAVVSRKGMGGLAVKVCLKVHIAYFLVCN